MLVNTKARVGVFSIALGAYLPQFPSLVPEFESQYAAFKKTLPDTVEVIDGGMVTTKEQAMEAGDKFRAADVDLVFLQMLTYATSYNMLPAVRDLDVPVVLVNVQKLKALDYDHTDLPISDIIVAVGYENNSYFHRVFKERYHMTPRVFREKNKQRTQVRL